VTKERDVDQILVECVQNGDKQAFSLLVLKYQRRLMRLVMFFVKDHAEAEDIVQETFIKAYRALANFRGESAFYTWLYRIGVNSAKNHLNAQRRRVPISTDSERYDGDGFSETDLVKESNTPDSMLASKQLAEKVNEAMNALPDELRLAISLREIEGLSYEEIAEFMECPIGTVRSRIFRAREIIAGKIRPLLDVVNDRRW
jgi:RNA polymerase sigma-70 factor (ECF subfamily)